MIELTHSETSVGMRAMNEFREAGVIINCDDPHNIQMVVDGDDSAGFYCVVQGCTEGRNPLYREES